MARKLCECGCGQIAPLASITSRKKGWVKGEPIRFVNGHHSFRRDDYVEMDRGQTSPCWAWQLFKNRAGYGIRQVKGRPVRAHRWYWERRRGPIPAGMQLHHECGHRDCVNPDHLRPVTPQEHIQIDRAGRVWKPELRARIVSMRQGGALLREIAEAVGLDQSTVSRHLAAAAGRPRRAVS